MKEILQRMTVRTWRADRKRLLELIEALLEGVWNDTPGQKTTIDGEGVFGLSSKNRCGVQRT